MQQGGGISPVQRQQPQHQHQRLTSINDPSNKFHQQHQQVPASAPPGSRSRLVPNESKPASTANTHFDHMLPGHDGYIMEEHLSYLSGGPFNRFALALKSNLDNEIDWACARLVAATNLLNDNWSILQHAPSLLEAILRVLERSRKELQQGTLSSDTGGRVGRSVRAAVLAGGSVKQVALGDSGLEMVVQRAGERGGLLSTALFNLSQVGDGAQLMAQDPRITIEATQWLRTFPQDDLLLVSIKAEFLDLLDTIIPLAPQPPFDTMPVLKWPIFGSREASSLDPLTLVETCLWEELVRIIHVSQERKLVLGALRLMVQSISWHPQLAREILSLPIPKWAAAMTAADNTARISPIGQMVNCRLAELILAPDVEIVGACFEVLLNTVRLEAMAKALDEELEAFAAKSGRPAEAAAAVRRRRRVGAIGAAGLGEAEASGGESGVQTPIFGFRPIPRSVNMATSAAVGAAAEESEPSMLPSGLSALVALVMQQWVAAAYPPTDITGSHPETHPGAHQPAQSQQTHQQQNQHQQQQQQQGMTAEQIRAAANRPPTEPELREACTWVLLNYEFVTPENPQQAAHQVSVSELFGRYKVAKQSQTVPHIGRALNINEMMRVVAAVFPKTTLVESIINQQQQQQQRNGLPGGGSSSPMVVYMALHLKARSPHIMPIPAVAVDNSNSGVTPRQPPAPVSVVDPNACLWDGCSEVFVSEQQAREHLAKHVVEADACRWRGCNRIPMAMADSGVDGEQLRRWISRHVLIHGPFYKPTAAAPASAVVEEEEEEEQE
ncbi:hypothetical protein LPJ66_002270 [Kickxella alabastrina]|uniref:Uncharacterized protein n=1 Tax=Kickxella alabastrina TaxID=61397 RepID=A0ACC1IQZ7_9FUNG|nr:hypothetical protein LPJ66_002270 [Kickxella alabastrina]